MLMLFSVVVAGCATSPGSLRQDPDARRAAVLAVPYQLVLKRIVEQYAECTAAPLVPLGTVINQVQHYSDLRQASITRGAEGIGRQIHQVIDIRETVPGQTELVVYATMAPDRHMAHLKRWAEGSSSCD